MQFNQSKYKKKLFTLLIWTVILLGMLAVLYLSWVSSPKIGGIRFMPSWLADWVDTYELMDIRTAIPLIVLGILVGLYLNYQKREVFWWIFGWIMLSLLVVLAELGQYFRPMRSFDWIDIAWGSAGSGLGLFVIFVGATFWNSKKYIK